MNRKPVFQYDGSRRKITWDGRLCIHAEECARSEGPLFETGRKPWAQPDLVDEESADEIVARCPTGALVSTSPDGVPVERTSPENTVTVLPNGPFLVRGNLDILGAPEDMPGIKHRAALCRCGLSRSKPFCDNSHIKAGFTESGAVGKLGPGYEAAGGPLTIECKPNASLLLRGSVTIIAASGQARWRGEKVSLCRCGLSSTKPFCDGSHKTSDFNTEQS